jgi:hypothetical protein
MCPKAGAHDINVLKIDVQNLASPFAKKTKNLPDNFLVSQAF